MNFTNKTNRRKFLGTCGKMSSLSVLSQILQLKMLNAAVSNNTSIPNNSYKALVCVFLNGGNDSFNMLTPWTSNFHNNYLEARSHVALQRNAPTNGVSVVAGLNPQNMPHFGINSLMPDVRNLYNSRQLAFLANVGTLVRPTSIQDVNNGNDLPIGLFSHREQQLSWQTSVPQTVSARGWIGRMSEVINDTINSNTDVSLNYSLSGASRLQTGNISEPFTITDSGANELNLYRSRADIRNTYDTSLNASYGNLLKQHYAEKYKEIIEQNADYNDTINQNGNPFSSSAFPNTSLGRQLRQVALTINARGAIGARRQSFFVQQNGFDSHSNLLENQTVLLTELNDALFAFSNAMRAIGENNNVTTYTASDFGRTITPNTTGTDHGWGGNQIIMGGAVNGRKVYGQYPSDLRIGANPSIDTGRGRFIPTTSVDEFSAELACWYGVGENDLDTILPNINNFNYSPLGILDL